MTYIKLFFRVNLGVNCIVLVSVIMGSYNHQQYLPEAIESVLNQTFKNLELIIIDDGSTDNSKQIIKTYQMADPRIHAIFHSENLGIPKTLNEGLKQASGKYVAFIGSDDVWITKKLEKQTTLIEKNDDKIIWAEGETISENRELAGLPMTKFLNAPPQKSGNLFQELLKEDFLFGQSVLFKTEFAREIGFDESLRYVNDHLFFVELARKHEFLFTTEPLALYRLHSRNISVKNSDQWQKERIILRKYFLQRYPGLINRQSLADIYCKMGAAFMWLGEKESARQAYLKATLTTPMRPSMLLNLVLAFTGHDCFLGRALTAYYQKANSLAPFFLKA